MKDNKWMMMGALMLILAGVACNDDSDDADATSDASSVFADDEAAVDEIGGDEAGEEAAGEEAGDEAGEEAAGEEAGDEAGEEAAGEEAGDEAGEEAAGEEAGDESAGEEAGDEAAGEEAGDEAAGEEAGDEATGEEVGDEVGDETAATEGSEEGAEGGDAIGTCAAVWHCELGCLTGECACGEDLDAEDPGLLAYAELDDCLDSACPLDNGDCIADEVTFTGKCRGVAEACVPNTAGGKCADVVSCILDTCAQDDIACEEKCFEGAKLENHVYGELYASCVQENCDFPFTEECIQKAKDLTCGTQWSACNNSDF